VPTASSAWSRTCSAPPLGSSGPSRRRSERVSRTCWCRAGPVGLSCRATCLGGRGAQLVPARSGAGRRDALAMPEGLAGVLGRAIDEVRAEARVPAGGGPAPGERAPGRGPRRRRRGCGTSRPGFTAVTLAGEVLASDGTLTGGVLEGPARARSRRSARSPSSPRRRRDRGPLQRAAHAPLRAPEADLTPRSCSRGCRSTTTRRSWFARAGEGPAPGLGAARALPRAHRPAGARLGRARGGPRPGGPRRGVGPRESAHAQAERAAARNAPVTSRSAGGLQRSAEATARS
jgi:hypothetical protein